MNTHAFDADETPHSAIGYRGFFPSCRLESVGRSGPAPITEPKPRPDGLAELQARRLSLLAEAQRHRDLRRNKAASLAEGSLRAVTHQILAIGKNFLGASSC